MESTILVAQLNARLQPIHRGEFFEDPLTEVLSKTGIGEITGGGSLVSEAGEIEYCDIEIEVGRITPEAIGTLLAALEKLGAPKGSILHIEAERRKVEFGKAEGLAVYLNGTDLPDNIYAECDSNFVLSEFDRLLGDGGRVLSYWQGPRETVFYMYGRSFDSMRHLLLPFLSTYPLCEDCRVEQIA